MLGHIQHETGAVATSGGKFHTPPSETAAIFSSWELYIIKWIQHKEKDWSIGETGKNFLNP
jgi:hypothetical protein